MQMGVAAPRERDGASVSDGVSELKDLVPADLDDALLPPEGHRLLLEDALDLVVRAVVGLVTLEPFGNNVVEQISGVTIVNGPSLSIDLTTGGYGVDGQPVKTDDKPTPSMPYDRQDLPGTPSKRLSARP